MVGSGDEQYVYIRHENNHITRWERIIEVDMPFIQRKPEGAFLFLANKNNKNIKIVNEAPSHMNEILG
ncbi:MAG TPA: hypothetical protein DD811_09100 [Syntrophomonas sp.]|jgi:hypothetical protein|nr:hypothetical protein [Syntrophomonas sp.]